jgi:hypothetical protein
MPSIAPCVTDSRVGVENQKGKTTTGEVVADGQTGLPAADDKRLNSFWIAMSAHDMTPHEATAW